MDQRTKTKQKQRTTTMVQPKRMGNFSSGSQCLQSISIGASSPTYTTPSRALWAISIQSLQISLEFTTTRQKEPHRLESLLLIPLTPRTRHSKLPALIYFYPWRSFLGCTKSSSVNTRINRSNDREMPLLGHAICGCFQEI